jgi:hypothetical protein
MKGIRVNKHNNVLVHFDCMKMLVKCGIEVHNFFFLAHQVLVKMHQRVVYVILYIFFLC